MKKINCSLSFREYSKPNYSLFCERVEASVYDNSGAFPAPPVTQAEFKDIFAKYSKIEVQYKIAPSVNKTNFINVKNDMDNTLTKIAEYVNTVANGNESIINLSGFVPTKNTASKSAPIENAATGTVKRGPAAGQISLESTAIKGKGTVNYSVVVAIGAPLPDGSFNNGVFVVNNTAVNCVLDYTRPRKKVISNLPPGSKVYVYFLAANPAGAAPIGEPIVETV